MKKGRIRAHPEAGEYRTRERCHVTELLNDDAAPAVSLARCRIEAGVTTERHRLDVDEWYVIERGHGRMELDRDAPFDVGPGDAVAIPAGSAQRIRNTGRADLVFLCVCVPRYTPSGYAALETT